MKRGKFVSFIRKICAVVVFCACFFTAGYCVGMRDNFKNIFGSMRGDTQSGADTQGEKNGGYSAILSGKWIYVYNETGTLCDVVYVYTEYMTEEDRAALSDGVEFKNEAEMLDFMESFK